MHRKWPLAAGLAVAVLLGAAGYGWWSHAQQKPPVPVVKPAAPVAPAAVELSLPGKIQAKNVVDVAAPMSGMIDQYLVDVGEEVFEGEVLARIKNTELESIGARAKADAERAQSHVSDLESALIAERLEVSRARSDAVRSKAEYERTNKEYQRQKMLYDQDATPRLTYEKAEKEFQNAKADYEGLQGSAQAADERLSSLTKEIETAKTMVISKGRDLDNLDAQMSGGEVRSPANGVVVARRGHAGEPVDEGVKDLIQIGVDLSSLQVVVDADPRSVQQIKPGQPALIQIAEAASAIQGNVREIKAGQVFVDFTSPSPVIKPGLTAQVKIKVS